jgi:hypothetical protein
MFGSLLSSGDRQPATSTRNLVQTLRWLSNSI